MRNFKEEIRAAEADVRATVKGSEERKQAIKKLNDIEAEMERRAECSEG